MRLLSRLRKSGLPAAPAVTVNVPARSTQVSGTVMRRLVETTTSSEAGLSVRPGVCGLLLVK